AVTTAAGVINNDARVKIGESVIIFGVGGVGMNIVQFADLAGAYPIVAVDLREDKLEMAKARGATSVVTASTNADVASEIRSIVGPNGADNVIETTGAKLVIESAYELTNSIGTCVLVGVPTEKITIDSLPLHFEKVLVGSHGGDAMPHIDIPRLMQLN